MTDHIDTADQDKLSKQGVGVVYGDRAPEACRTCLANNDMR